MDLPRGPYALALTNGRIVLPDRVVVGKAILLEGGVIVAIADEGDLGAETKRVDVGGRIIAPGLIDIHIHGALGHTFNEPTEAAFAAITQECARCGVTSVLATTATAPIADLVSCLAFTHQWMQELRDGAQVLGAHVEGPYFARAQAGAQDPAHLRTPDDGTAIQLLAYHDVMRIMTYAPELPGALYLTRLLMELGVTPAAGHSAAREEDVRPCIAAGLRHMIHIWSGQSTTVREGPWRKPGMLEVTLTYDGLTAEMIADNRHLPPTLMKLAYKCLGADRLCLISDATSGAGLREGARFRMGGMEYEVSDGVGMMLDRSAFAGSTTLLNRMAAIVVEVLGVSLAEAVRMASLTPARVIGVDQRKGSLEPGKDADIVVFQEDFTPWRVMIGGEWVNK